jgi:hypothetical protein
MDKHPILVRLDDCEVIFKINPAEAFTKILLLFCNYREVPFSSCSFFYKNVNILPNISLQQLSEKCINLPVIEVVL